MNYFIQSLTYFRIVIAPIIFILIVSDFYGWALLFTFVASFSDFWDGYLARRFKLESTLGGILDPIADKILLTFLILSLSVEISSSYMGFIGGLILIREFWVSALRQINARNNNEDATKVSFLAKSKTFIQFLSLTTILLGLYISSPLVLLLGNFMLMLSVLITLKTGLDYTVKTFSAMK
jgi:CDP-diacylglycerol--glycerol-3-phosphate 3-phosphatidyltransferase